MILCDWLVWFGWGDGRGCCFCALLCFALSLLDGMEGEGKGIGVSLSLMGKDRLASCVCAGLAWS